MDTYHRIMDHIIQTLSLWTKNMQNMVIMAKHMKDYTANPIDHNYDNINLLLFHLVNGAAEFFGTRLFDNQLSRGILPLPKEKNNILDRCKNRDILLSNKMPKSTKCLAHEEQKPPATVQVTTIDSNND